MNGHHQGHNPHSPLAMLFTLSANGEPAPEGYAWNANSQLVKLAYQPWAQGPQVPWESWDNKDYLALVRGESTIEIQPSVDPTAPPNYGQDPLGRAVPPLDHTNVALVPNEAYVKEENNDEPENSVGTTNVTRIGMRGMVAQASWRIGRGLVGYVQVPSPDADYALGTADPAQPALLNVPPVQAAISDAPIGGCVSLAQVSFGEKGGQFQTIIDVPPAQIIHLPFTAGYGRIDSMLAPKYYNVTTQAVTNFRQYLLFPGGPVLTSALWNSLQQSVLPQNAFTGLTTNPNGTIFSGWIVAGESFSNTTFAQPMRRFFGTVLCTAVLPVPLAVPPTNGTSVTICPVAWYASQVTLVANPGLNFIVRGLTSAGGIQQTWGPFPANVAITLPAGAVDVLVFPIIDLSQPGAPRIEEYFELDYIISW